MYRTYTAKTILDLVIMNLNCFHGGKVFHRAKPK